MIKHSILLLTFLMAINFIATADRILLIVDNADLINTHSRFISLLASPRNNKTKDNEVEIALTYQKTTPIQLKNYDRFKYDSIVVMCTSQKQMQSRIKVKDIISYFDEGGNVIVLGDVDTSVSFRKLFLSFGISLDQTGTIVKDYFSNHKRTDIIVTENFESIHPFLGNTDRPLLYRGTGLQLVNYENYQLYNLVKAEPTTFAKNEIKNEVARAGSQISLIAGVQGLNNARALISGGLDFFSDQLINESGFGNEQAVKDFIQWTFNKNGKIRVNYMKYFGEGAEGKESLFNVGEKLYFETQIEELDQRTQSWKPYVASDIQVELVMLDPWVRVPLTLTDAKKGQYKADFWAPQKEGIYQFKIIYKKSGFNFVTLAERVTIRPYKHDQFERFLFVAYPYFFSVWSTIIATFAFVVIYLYSSWAESKQKNE